MSEEEKFIKCKNCHQNISESKIFLHEGFCLRNNKLCPECDKVFLIKEFEEHIKTHNNIKKEKKNSITEHRKNCHHNKEKINPQPPSLPKKQKPEIKLDDNLGLQQCIYCTNMFEDLQNHLKECEIKKMIENENEKYYSELEKRKKLDNDLAEKLSKEKIMDISKDEQMAKELQNNLKFIDTNKDEEMALNLQKQFQNEINNTNKDEEFARNLQNELGNEYNIQQDEEFARRLQQQENANNNYEYYFPNNMNNNNEYQ